MSRRPAKGKPLDGRGAGWSMTLMRKPSLSPRPFVLLLAGLFMLGLAGPVAAGKDRSDAMIQRGLAAADAGRLEEARGWYERAIVQFPASADAYARLGRTEAELGERRNARKYYRTALEIDPNHADALSWAGQLDLLEGNRKAAETKLLRLKRTCTDCPQTAALSRALDASSLN